MILIMYTYVSWSMCIWKQAPTEVRGVKSLEVGFTGICKPADARAGDLHGEELVLHLVLSRAHISLHTW